MAAERSPSARRGIAFTCRVCRGTGGACSKHRTRGLQRDCDNCREHPCYCCTGTGDHLGGVCMKDLQGGGAQGRLL